MKKVFRLMCGAALMAAIIAVGAMMVAAAGQSDDVQTIEATVGVFSYPAIAVEVDKPVRVNFKVSASNLNGCNNEIIIPEWNIRQTLAAGDNFVEFTPTETGTFVYSCWMDMIRSSITVIEQGAGDIGASASSDTLNNYGGGCGMMYGYGGSGLRPGYRGYSEYGDYSGYNGYGGRGGCCVW